jgi:RimJ/RimL family protein N-acetyltransferase
MRIRPLTELDLPIRVEWMNDPRVYTNMGFTPPITLEGTKQWFKNNQGNNNRIDLTYLDESNNVVGFCGLTHIDWATRQGETYSFISPNFQSQGHGTNQARMLIDYAFSNLKLNKLTSHIDETNRVSCRVREKLGFKLEGIIRQDKLLNGSLIDRYYYGLLASDVNTSK